MQKGPIFASYVLAFDDQFSCNVYFQFGPIPDGAWPVVETNSVATKLVNYKSGIAYMWLCSAYLFTLLGSSLMYSIWSLVKDKPNSVVYNAKHA